MCRSLRSMRATLLRSPEHAHLRRQRVSLSQGADICLWAHMVAFSIRRAQESDATCTPAACTVKRFKVCAMQADALQAVKALRVYFVDALHNNVATGAEAAGSKDAAGAVFAFVRSKYAQYHAALIQVLRSKSSEALQLEAVMAVMDCTRAGAPASSAGILAIANSTCVRAVQAGFQFRMLLSSALRTHGRAECCPTPDVLLQSA